MSDFTMTKGFIYAGRKYMQCGWAFVVSNEIMQLVEGEFAIRSIPWDSFEFANSDEEEKFYNAVCDAIELHLEKHAYDVYVNECFKIIEKKGISPFNIHIDLEEEQIQTISKEGSLLSKKLMLPETNYMYNEITLLDIASKLGIEVPDDIIPDLENYILSETLEKKFNILLNKLFAEAFMNMPQSCVDLILSNPSGRNHIQIVSITDVVDKDHPSCAVTRMKIGKKKFGILINASGKNIDLWVILRGEICRNPL